jgi:glycosyltransferase involved in cell wall biosynthesis
MFRAVKILHLADRLSARGGADWHLLGVLRAQERDPSVSVQLAAGRSDGTVEPPCALELVEGLDSSGRGAARLDTAPLDRLLTRARPDLLHLHNVVNPGVLEWAAAAPLPALMTVQDHRSFCPGRGKWTLGKQHRGEVCREPLSRERCASCFTEPGYFEAIYDVTRRRLSALARLDALTVLSEFMRSELSSAGVSARRVRVIPPFVHGLGRDEADGPPCVLFVGRLVPAKGPGDAVEVWRRSGLAPELPLVLAGTGSARQTLADDPGAQLLGWVAHEALGAVYRRARVLLLPCRWQEPFGIVGLEALSLGVPVAAWESGGVSEWHPGPLADWGDVDALAAEAARLVDRGEPAPAPTGFGEADLMQRLHRLYQELLR